MPLGVQVAAVSPAVTRELNFRSAQRGAVGRRVVRWGGGGGERCVASDEWDKPASVLELGWGAARAGSGWRARAGAARAVVSWRARAGAARAAANMAQRKTLSGLALC